MNEELLVIVSDTDFHLTESGLRYYDTGANRLFAPVEPWPLVPREQCHFYHCMDFPDGESIDDAAWDLRGLFDSYIGHYPLQGKTVLDVGTASGFLAFSAEEAGAARVTALDACNAREFERIPFAGSPFTEDRWDYITTVQSDFIRQKNSFWHAWHKKLSAVEVVYAPISQLWRWQRRFDVVIAGAVVEHLSDPVQFIGCLAGLAKEAIILPATHVMDEDRLIMETLNPWDRPQHNYTWWCLSRGLYQRIFNNLGFSVQFFTSMSRSNLPENAGAPEVVKPTILARR